MHPRERSLAPHLPFSTKVSSSHYIWKLPITVANTNSQPLRTNQMYAGANRNAIKCDERFTDCCKDNCCNKLRKSSMEEPCCHPVLGWKYLLRLLNRLRCTSRCAQCTGWPRARAGRREEIRMSEWVNERAVSVQTPLLVGYTQNI